MTGVSRDLLNSDTGMDQVPPQLHEPVRVARAAWALMYPGMENDGSADVVVTALAAAGWLRVRPNRAPTQTKRAIEKFFREGQT